MKVGTCVARPGRVQQGELPLGKDPDGRELSIPVFIAQGKKEGKTIFLSAGMHGNELNGIELMHRFLDIFEAKEWEKELCGTIIFLPILNPFGFFEKTRYVPFDGKDLNRAFNRAEPSYKKTISNDIADRIMDAVVAHCDFGLDLHDAGRQRILIPHTRIHKNEKDGCTREMASLFGTDIVMQREGKRGMMAIEAHKLFGIPVLTVELGGGFLLIGEFVRTGLRGIKNILRHHGMVTGKIIVPEKQFFLDRRVAYTAPQDGLYHIQKQLGESIDEGETVATVYNPVTRARARVVAEYCSVLFSIERPASVRTGEDLFSLLHFDVCPFDKRKPINAKMMKNAPTKQQRVVRSTIFEKALRLPVSE